MNSEETVRAYSDMMYKIAYRYLRNQYDAEDAVSEAFLTYFKKEREFESEEHRRAWLIRVTVNEAKDILSGKTNAEEINEEILGEDTSGADTEEILDLREAIKRLPAHQKEVIALFYMQELSINEIASVLGKNKSTVAVTLARARENLKSYLEN